MNQPDYGTLQAARINLQGCGCLGGPYYPIQRADITTLGYSATEAANVAIDAGDAYLKSGNIKDIYGPAIKIVQGFSAALPPPLNLIATFAEEKAKDAIDAIQDYYTYSAECAAQFLPADVAPEFVKWFTANAASLWADAAKDRVAYWLRDYPTIANYIASNTSLNTKVQTRLADQFYKKALSLGAKDRDAAMVAYKMVCNQPGNASVDDPTAAASYAKKVDSKVSPKDYFGMYKSWQGQVAAAGGKQVNSKDYNNAAPGAGDKAASGGGMDSTTIAIIAAAAIGLYFVARK